MPDWNRVRYEMLTRLGYFVTESSEHFAEYCPYFIRRDRPDLLEYRDMVTIVRDRIQSAIKKGMTLEQVKAAGLTKDYDNRYGAKSGSSRTGVTFVEVIYKSLTQKR